MPTPEAPVIANNTPLVALWVLGRLDLLRDLYTEVLIPDEIGREFLASEAPLRQAALENAPWIKVAPLANPQHALVYAGLDQGEAQVLALAVERSASLVIIDERQGRRYARRLGLPMTGTVGILLLAKERGLVSALAPLLDNLEAAGLYLAPDLVSYALRLAGESPPAGGDVGLAR